MFQEEVTLFFFKTIAVILVITAIGIFCVEKRKEVKDK